MNKTLLIGMIALACLATAVPTASACQAYGPGAFVINYAWCHGGAASDAGAAVAFVTEEAGDVVEFVQSTELYNSLP